MDTSKRIYISGKITADPDYFKKFDDAENDLIGNGYSSIVNPAAVNLRLPADFSHDDYMRVSLAELHCCQAVYFLKDWKDSPGALREFDEAKRRGMEIIFQ